MAPNQGFGVGLGRLDTALVSGIHVAGPVPPPIPAALAISLSPLRDDRVAGKEAGRDLQGGSSVHSVAKILCRVHSLVSTHVGHEYFRGSCQSTYLFPKLHCCQFSNHIPPKSLIVQLNHWPGPMDWYLTTHLASSPPKQTARRIHLSSGRIFFHHLLQRCSRERLLCCSCPHVGGACISCRTIYKPGPSLFLL